MPLLYNNRFRKTMLVSIINSYYEKILIEKSYRMSVSSQLNNNDNNNYPFHEISHATVHNKI